MVRSVFDEDYESGDVFETERIRTSCHSQTV